MGLFDTIGDFLSGGNNSKASNARGEATTQFKELGLPDIEDMKINLQQLVSQGKLSPEQAQTFLQEKSGMSGISLDPKLQQAQMDALSSLQGLGQGGLSLSDKSDLNQIASQESTQARGAREAILQNAQSKGMGGSGAELMAQLQNSQDAASRISQRDMNVSGQAQQRALQALMQAGQLGGQMQTNSFNQQAAQAQSQDAINRFNAQNRQDVQNKNVQSYNEAQSQNLANQQRISDTNTGLANQQEQYNKNLAQQDFENRYKKAGGVAGAIQNEAQGYQQAGKGIQDLIGSGLQAGATIWGKK